MSSILILGDIFIEMAYIYTKDLFGVNWYIVPSFFCDIMQIPQNI